MALAVAFMLLLLVDIEGTASVHPRYKLGADGQESECSGEKDAALASLL